MKKAHLIFIVCCLLFNSAFTVDSPDLVLYFFGSGSCPECVEIKTTLLQPILAKHHGRIAIRFYDIDSDSGFQLALNMEDKYNVPLSSPQELFFPDTFLLGYDAIKKDGLRMINYYIDHPEKWMARSAATDTAKLAKARRERPGDSIFQNPVRPDTTPPAPHLTPPGPASRVLSR